jgi:hypothetical protein
MDMLAELLAQGRRRPGEVQILERAGPRPPRIVACLESDYLKCVIARVRSESVHAILAPASGRGLRVRGAKSPQPLAPLPGEGKRQ